MKESEEAGMEGLAVQDFECSFSRFSRGDAQSGQTTPAASIVRISKYRVPQMLPVGANLVGPAGFQPEVHCCPRF